MSEKARSRNEQIAEMLRNGEKLKNFYRFTAQNPHIELHDACQIVLAHPKASICFYIDEWNELGRRVTQGRKGIMFYDADGNKQYVYDLHDTHGDRRYRRLTYSMRRLLYGLDELNGTELAASNRRDYSKVLSGVAKYLDENGYFTEDERRNSLIAEGVAYSLYSKTGFPKDNNISLRGMAYGLNENARLFKEIYFLTETAKEDINVAYERRIRTPQVIEDIDEDVISDEPTFQDESEETSRESVEPKNTVNIEASAPSPAVISEEEKTADNPMYRRYLNAQREDPEAVVLNRVGDFYEVFGEYAKEVSGWLDLTLTGRDVGLAERVPMCGFPFYAADTYIEKILEHRGVVVLEADSEPIHIRSHKEAPAAESEQPIEDLEPQTEADDRFSFDAVEIDELNELLSEELSTSAEPLTATEQSEISGEEEDRLDTDEEEEFFEDEESSGILSEDEDKEEPDDLDAGSKRDGKRKSLGEKNEIGIQDRKRKEKPQMSMFDLLNDKPKKSRENKIVDYCLKEEHSDYKLDYYDAYQKNLPVSGFVSLFKRHYGEYSGHSDGEKSITNTTKGKTIEWRDKENPENNLTVHLKWTEVAVRIAELIENDAYLTASEKKEYARIVRFRKEREGAKTDAERCRVIADQIVEYGTQKAYGETYSEYPHFLEESIKFYLDHKQEVNRYLAGHKEVKSIGEQRDMFDDVLKVSFHIKYCPHWQEILRRRLAREHRVQDFADRFIRDCADNYIAETDGNRIAWTVEREELSERDYLFIKDNRDEFTEYLQNKTGVENAEFSMQRIEIVFDRGYIAGIASGNYPPPAEYTRLVREIADKIVSDGTKNTTEGNWVHYFDEFGEDETFARENAEEIAAELERHQEVSDVELTPDAFDTNFYLDYCPNYIPHKDEDGYEEEPKAAETEQTPEKPIKPFNRFTELSAEDKAFFDEYIRKPNREPRESPWDTVQDCTVIAPGIYSVSTAGHGGIMIDRTLAPHILSSEALSEGFVENGCYCYEEDAAESIPLRELYDKGILDRTNGYFTQLEYVSNNPESEDEYIRFTDMTEAEQDEKLKNWNKAVNECLAHWYSEYWAAYEQSCRTETEWQVRRFVDLMVEEGLRETHNGDFSFAYNHYTEEAEQFAREHGKEIAEELTLRKEVQTVGLNDDGIDVKFHREYCSCLDDISLSESKNKEGEQGENTDLNAVLDQSELGGAKSRFKGNTDAIRLMNKLYFENREATDTERKVLAKYVGWGGLAQAFDETNKQWSKEYAELKDLLTTEQYEKAKGSVLNAHYTSKEVIGGIYAALERFGVKDNNRILEPAMGTGNFFGYMPQEISDSAKLYGVELDEVTGKIAAKLYPQAKVQIKGFEETSFPQDYFDIVVGNVPFGGYSVYDSEYSRQKFMIHDYFIAKSIDRVKPNGIVAVVTSKGTMDKLSPVARKYMAERAELLGAIRLPNNAFKQTANTEAVTDILFFQKREERINDTSDIEWLGTGKTEDGFEVNNYFIRHPEMVLGTFAKETGLYGAEGLTVKPDGRDLGEALAAAVNNLPQNIYENPEQVPIDMEETESTDVFNIRPMCYIAMNGKVYMRVGETLVEQEIPAFPKDAYERIAGMIDLRDELRHVLDIQTEGCTDEALNRAQWKLNADYDRFVRKYGIINGQTNTRLFREDGDAALLFACEVLSEDKTKATKADIFTKRTIRPYSVPTHTNDTLEALQICRNERGGVDLSYIEELTGKDFDTVLSELGDTVYRDPASVKEGNKYSGYQTAEDYLSGKVVEKLRIAQEYSKQDESYLRNVTALEKVQPEPLKADEISVRIGASWVKPEYYRQFLMELLDIYRFYKDDLKVRYNSFDSSWKVERADHVRKNAGMNATEIYGTNRANAFRLFEDCLNQRATSIYDTVEEDGREKRVLNQAETIAAREKQNKIKEAFADWIYAEPKRREDLEITYNSLFNQIRLPSYDGSYLKFPGMNPAIELRPHQKNAVARIAGTGNSTLLHHVVGSGKSYTMSASAMKLRQYGLAKKPMIVVPNHLVQQMANEFRTLYPTAKLLIANKEDLEKNKRKQFVSKVAMGDWDSVIIAQSSFAKIPVSRERQERMMRGEIAKIEAAILEMREESGMRTAVKNLERIKKGREAMLKKLLDSGKKDDVLIFENLGVDYLFVDEADAYKNRFLYTKMNNVSGISNAASARASDMQMKIEYINELHGGDKGVVFATGTPISNSMAEMYVMQSYLQKNTLEELGIDYFDGWAADFGETVTALEMAPSGQGYRARTRFAKFTNLPELMTLYRSFADVQTADMVKLDVPEAERITITLEPSEQTVQIAEEIAKRAEAIYNGGVDPHLDNMLKVTSDGKKLALDVRCFDQFLKDEGIGKLDECADNAAKVYEETNAIRGTQLIFCDMATPKKPYEEYEYGKDFDVYNDLKHKLIERGIPKEEIAFIHDAKTDKEKQALFDKMNEGRIRILIGSTEKCGAGTNVQKRLAALHHLDAPYRPRDLQQRDGRGIRQHNMNKSVKIFTYVKKRTLDSYCYQILENKQRFISQIENGSLTVREAEDIDETTLSYAEIKAITAANPKIKRKMELETELTRLRVLEGQYRKNLYALQDKTLKDLPTQIHAQEQLLQYVQEDEANMRMKYNPHVFSINVLGKIYTDKKEGAAALVEALRSNKYDTPVAEYGGFRISLNPPTVLTDTRSVSLTHHGSYGMEIGDSALGLITRLDNFMSDFHEKKGRFTAKLEQLKRDLTTAEAELKKPFEHKGKIEDITQELSEINAELDLNKHEEVVIDTDEENDNEEVNYMVLPEKETEKTEPAKRPHKRMTEKQYKLYADYTGKFPDTVIFLKNGDFYETVGDEADIAANVYGAETYEKELGGENRIVAMLTYENLDAMVNALAEKDRLFKIVEQENEIDREVDFLETNETVRHVMRQAAEKTKHEAENLEQVTKNVRAALENLQSDPSMERAGYKERFFAAFAEFIENAEDYYLRAEDIAELVKDGDAVTERVYSYYMDTIDQINIDDWSEFTELTKNYIDERERNYEMTKEPIDHGDWKTAQGKDVRSYNASLRANIECRYAIEEAIRNNFDGRHLNKDFENGLIEQFGMERVIYVLANTVQELEYDGRFSRDTKAWANSITVTERSDHRNQFVVSSHPAVLDGFIERVRKAEKIEEQKKEKGGTMQEEKYRKETLKGLPVVQIERDKYGHDIAIVKRKEDFVVAIGYNVKDGTWAQGRYDFSTQELAQEFIDKNYKPNTEEKGQEKKWLTAKVSRDALIRRYDRHSFFRMPNGEYEDYTYNVFNSRIKESRQLVELESDGHELCYEIVIPADEEVVVKNRDGDEIIFTAEEFTNLIGGTANKDYERKENDGNTNWFAISLPQEALRGSYEKSSLFVMPLKSEFTGYSYYIPNVFIEEDKREENGNILITLPEDFKVTIKNKATDEELVITVFDLFNECNATQGEDYARVKSEHQTDAEEKRQIITVIPANAKIARYENQTLFKMPEKGEYAGYCFYLFNDKLSDADDKIQVKLSEDFTVYLNDKKKDRTAELAAAELKAIMDRATAEDFIRTFGKNEELFKEQEELLRKNVPQEMLERPNWVIVRTRKNEEKNKTDKFLISPVTGKFAEIDEPETWTDFETACKYARENGGVTLAYALDGKDKICCIDMDKCLDGYGKITETGAKVRRASGKTYSEISVSGNGMHVFGKMDDMDLRVYSNDGTLEFYQKSHFITMTGNSFGNRELLNFNELPIKSLLEEKCKKRSEYLNAGKGIEGLSSMTDREVIEKACAAKHGETFKALYNGQDIKNNHSNSDMALMTRLAFWCNGDKDQMQRIFATSGLYRPNKSPEYYEYTAMKAVKENAERYTPKSTADKFDSPNRAKKAEGNSK